MSKPSLPCASRTNPRLAGPFHYALSVSEGCWTCLLTDDCNGTQFRRQLAWDESVFMADRDGVADRSGVPTFTVQGPDEGAVIHGVSPSGIQPAPSRPPSRNQSPLGRLVDLTAHDAAGTLPALGPCQ